MESIAESKISTDSLEETRETLKFNIHQKSTKKNYHQIWLKFNQFLIRLDRLPESWEERVSLYCTYLWKEGIQSATMKSYLSAIKGKIKADGNKWDEEQFNFNALVKACRMENDVLYNRLPIRRPFLECILFEIERRFTIQSDESYLESMFKTAYLLQYYGLLRVGEIADSVHVLKACDVHVANNDEKILIILHSSKTHTKADRPQEIRITRDLSAKHFCPVEETRKYSSMRPPWYTVNDPFLVYENGRPVQPQEIRDTLRIAIKNLKLDASLYDTHLFRIGRATDLRKLLGYTVEDIKSTGRWKSNSVYNYLRH